MYRFRQAFILLTLLSLLTVGLLIGKTHNVHAETLPDNPNCTKGMASTNGGRAKWETCIKTSSVDVSGTVEHTVQDKTCTTVVGMFYRGHYLVKSFHARACSKGFQAPFSWIAQRANRARVSVFEAPAEHSPGSILTGATELSFG